MEEEFIYPADTITMKVVYFVVAFFCRFGACGEHCHCSSDTPYMAVNSISGVGRNISHHCPSGLFPCNDSITCLPGKVFCDGFSDCPNEFDEDIDVCEHQDYRLDSLGLVFSEWRYTKIRSAGQELTQKKCTRWGTIYDCTSLQLTSFPEEIGHNATEILLNHNFLTTEDAIFSNFTDLENLYIANNKITALHPQAFHGLEQLKMLYLGDNLIEELHSDVFSSLVNLRFLSMPENKISNFDEGALSPLESLKILELRDNRITTEALARAQLPKNLTNLILSHNLIKRLSKDTFSRMPNLVSIDLESNLIETVDEDAFESVIYLDHIDLSHNRIAHFPKNFLLHNFRLTFLSINHNPVKELDNCIFHNLRNLEGIKIHNINVDMFACLKALRIIKFQSFSYCKYVPHVMFCQPKGDGLSSINNLIESYVLRVCIWAVAVTTMVLNSVVVIGRVCFQGENQAHSLIIKNLAASDFLMGLYLLVIAIKDAELRHIFNKEALTWMTSHLCTWTGILAVTSSEVSVLILTYLSLERFVMIVYPYTMRNISLAMAALIMVALWVLGLVIALIPIFGLSPTFYSSNSVCFPLHLHEPFADGWQYSTAVFICFNSIALIIIAFCYASIFRSIQQTRRETSECVHGAARSSFAQRFFLIVLTDALCWLPIVVIKILALTHISISDGTYAWLAVFVLPINSALNPLLYSMSTRPFKKHMSGLADRIRHSALYFTRSASRRSSSTSATRSMSLGAVRDIGEAMVQIHTRYSPTFTQTETNESSDEKDEAPKEGKIQAMLKALRRMLLRQSE